jgi:hypothetical protein
MRGLADHHRALTAELSRWGIKPKIEKTNGGHVRFKWNARGKELQIIAASTSSDHRTRQNNLARVRRMMRDVGLADPETVESLPLPKPSPPPIVRSLTIDDRIARLEAVCAKIEQQVETILDLVTDPNRFVENFVPMKIAKLMAAPTIPPPLTPMPASKPAVKTVTTTKQYIEANCWLWRAMRYDKFLTAAEIAKAGGRSVGAASVMLCVWKKRGYVDHVGKTWRKNRKVEELGREGATQH